MSDVRLRPRSPRRAPDGRSDPHAGRYDAQAWHPEFGTVGQAALQEAKVAVLGMGALGSAAAETLARAGVGGLRVIDRDVVELGNLHRQSLYDEADVARASPKATAAAERLARLRSDLVVEPVVADVDGEGIEEILTGCDLVLDGTDSFETRAVLGEAALSLGLPWIHAACLGSRAVVWPVTPDGACFTCLVPEVPAPGESATCETAGILPPAVQVAAAVQVAEAMKLFAGAREALLPGPWTLDVWTGRATVVEALRDPDCPACGRGRRRWLGRRRRGDVVACGRSGVQLARAGSVDLDAVERAVGERADVVRNAFLIRFSAGDHEVTVFRDGRVLVGGTSDPARARAVAARWLGG